MNRFQESKIFELTCISPIHIGSGESLRPFEYLYDKQRGIVYFINKTRFIALLSDHGIMEDYVDYISQSGSLEKINLLKWLKAKGIGEETVISLASRKAEAPYSVLTKDNSASLNSLNTGVSLADGRLYIPGSSLKGALRTGILYHLIKKDPKLAEKFSKQILNILGQNKFNNELNKLARSIETGLLDVLEQQKNNQSLNSAMRGLKVSDAMPVEKYDSVVVRKLDASTKIKKNGENESRLPLCRECIKPGSRYSLTISADIPMLKKIGISSIDEILDYAHQAKTDEIKLFKKYFPKYHSLLQEAETADFSIGAGTGFLNKTLWLAIFSDKDVMADAIKKYLDTQFKKHNHLRDRGISPRTLKLSQIKGEKQLMGLCSLREVK